MKGYFKPASLLMGEYNSAIYNYYKYLFPF